MFVSVRLVGILAACVGSEHLDVDCEEGCTVDRLLDILCERYGGDPERDLGGDVRGALALVDGVEIGVLRGGDTTLKSGSEVVLLPVLHGG